MIFFKSFLLFENWQYVLSCRFITSSKLIQLFRIYKQSFSRNYWVSTNFNIYDFKYFILSSCLWDCLQKKIRLLYEIDCSKCFLTCSRDIFDYIFYRYDYLFITWTYHSVFYFAVLFMKLFIKKNQIIVWNWLQWMFFNSQQRYIWLHFL